MVPVCIIVHNNWLCGHALAGACLVARLEADLHGRRVLRGHASPAGSIIGKIGFRVYFSRKQIILGIYIEKQYVYRVAKIGNRVGFDRMFGV